MIVIGIDPGYEVSAVVFFGADDSKVIDYIYDKNERVLQFLSGLVFANPPKAVIEKVASYGMPVGETIFQTVFWSGSLQFSPLVGTSKPIIVNISLYIFPFYF